ncbi:hypothetical protein ACKWRH_25390 [Bradyrhizobium sp. Pa8]|uniref:hypothetical protein n=1 Tax=Bradyrhizobium sp. Pa8 TaxID=3386552 RepID=UPI00403FB06F
MTDWTDKTLRPLDELARLAFPEGSGVTADTLKRLARAGKLVVYRPGKPFLSTLANVWEMVQATRVGRKPPPRPASSDVPNGLGLTEVELAQMRCEHALNKLRNEAIEREREDAWERKYEARKAARAKARPPRNKR